MRFVKSPSLLLRAICVCSDIVVEKTEKKGPSKCKDLDLLKKLRLWFELNFFSRVLLNFFYTAKTPRISLLTFLFLFLFLFFWWDKLSLWFKVNFHMNVVDCLPHIKNWRVLILARLLFYCGKLCDSVHVTFLCTLIEGSVRKKARLKS
jgi:hypothetical protein